LLECVECLGIDHFKNDCPLINSAGYRAVHPSTDEDNNIPVIGTSLSSIGVTSTWTSVPAHRGGGHGTRGSYQRAFRGGSHGGRGRGHSFGPY
jgi:hypothetical protein